MAITISELQAFKPDAYTTSSTAWQGWADAVVNHSKDLKAYVHDPLDSNWKGTAALTAQTSLSTVHGEMSVSADLISSVNAALKTAGKVITGAHNDLEAALQTLAGTSYKLDDASGKVSLVSGLSKADIAKWTPVVTAAQTKITAALTTANNADQDVANALKGLTPPPPNTPNGPGTNLSSNPGSSSDSGSSGSNGGSADSAGSTAVSSVTAQQAMALGQKMAAARGWTGQQFTCLQKLWVKESGWNAAAKNPSSGAFGIPQSLPADKMASAGADWQTNPATQIKWGLDYIAGRYGNPCGAWAHEVANNWY